MEQFSSDRLFSFNWNKDFSLNFFPCKSVNVSEMNKGIEKDDGTWRSASLNWKTAKIEGMGKCLCSYHLTIGIRIVDQ